MPKCGYCKAEVEKGAKECPACGKGFVKAYAVGGQSNWLGIVFASFISLFFGISSARSGHPFLSLVILLSVNVAYLVWRWRRKFRIVGDYIIIACLILGFLFGLLDFDIPYKSVILVVILVAMLYAAYFGVVTLVLKLKKK